MYNLKHGDCVEVMKGMPDNSVDSIVTDPPYELGFMGKSWDSTGIAYNVDMWKECLRVLKPGGHLLSFGGSRTYHRMACAIEDAGFEIRDQIMWVYGSGFPKSLSIGKAIDKMYGAERKIIGEKISPDGIPYSARKKTFQTNGSNEGYRRPSDDNPRTEETAPATPEAKHWEGFGTALKPAHEPIVLARKPLSEKTVAENVLKWGTGGINVDGCRVGVNPGWSYPNGRGGVGCFGKESLSQNLSEPMRSNAGRFPANFIHDGSDEVVGLFPVTKTGDFSQRGQSSNTEQPSGWKTSKRELAEYKGDSGSAARFFYCAKASRSERGEGNNHPTVKPIKLMQYLCKLITPPGGTVLDPFCGSGSTIVACKNLNFNAIGIDLSEDYLKIAELRIKRGLERNA